VANQAKPMNERGVTPPKGRLTWMAIIGVALFVILLLAVTLRPAVDRQDGVESGATAPTTSSAPTDAGVSSAPTESAPGR
jgi:hypothetical protein